MEPAQHVSRFIGLAPVNNPNKQKWLYAFSCTPMRELSRDELVVQPDNCTEFPYMEILKVRNIFKLFFIILTKILCRKVRIQF